ncbi:MAG: acyltransferase [Clostridia bacterium]|nr:acyltransferase [Clostridia bacterium]
MKQIDSKNSLLSLSCTELLRVVFETMVLIHHLYLVYTSLGAVITNALGPIAVGGFIFLSGFGVGLSFIKKGDEYAKKLLKVRVPKIYLTLFIVDLCYLVLYLALGGEFNNLFSAIISVFYLPVFNGFVALSHWIYFLADLLIYYLLFLLFIFIFRKTKNRLLNTALVILAIDLIIIVVLSIINYKTGSSRYLRACLCFPIGLICSAFNEELSFVVKGSKPILLVVLSLISVFTITICIIPSVNSDPIKEYVLPILAIFALVVILCGVNFKSKFISYASSLVLCVYVSHEFFLNLFQELLPMLHRNIIGLIVFVCSVLFAIAINSVIKYLKKKIDIKKFVFKNT